MGPSVVAAGVLHECLDRSMMTEEQLTTLISADVVELVVGVSKMSRVSELCREKNIAYQEVEIEKLRTMILAMEDARVVVIKMCDRLMSLRRLDSFPAEMRAQFCEETMEIFVPLASRLGLWKLKSELEDTYFKVTNPAEHDRLLTKVATSTRPERIIPHISKLQAALHETGVEASDLTGRPKNLYGIHKKMVKKGKTIDEVYDLRAMRVIVSDTKACYRALEAVNSLWQPLEGRTKDYIKNAKANGYQSLHTVVTGDDGLPFEIQIRTAEMHKVAEYGVAAHWRYKESLDVSGAFHDAQIAWARFVLSWTSELNDHKCRAEGSAKATTSARCLCPFPHHHSHCPHGRLEEEPHPPAAREDGPIFVLLVDGTNIEVKELPAGSTKRDLLELSTSGRLSSRASLIVNQEEESLDTPLNMGDLVEVVHSLEFEFEKPLEKPRENCFDFWESQGVGSTDFFGGFDLPTSEYADFEHLDTSPAGIAKARARLSRVF
ncbi:hypothetical protein CYMTET_42936 [Cymbomonas tetramitiformis]|uniref:RelA/SpoT domain-containing protein n=1 Tax=Cymbomonas tetramitiformis TaxID=36881 RepID=A0AAE0C4G8_9CHLO|nr:hypothetical protein CYMTET_42936 [Cymbomonas tetramitiformis]